MVKNFHYDSYNKDEYDKEIIAFACKVLSQNEREKAISLIFERLGTVFNLSRAFLLRANEIPFIVEVTDVWEAEQYIGNKKLSFNYTEWKGFNPFLVNNQVIVLKDIDDTSHDVKDTDYFKQIDAKALVSCVITKGTDYIGSTVFVNSGSTREWTNLEINTMNEVSKIITPILVVARNRIQEDMLLKDARRAVDEANQIKNQFLANMSHEIRTPLNAVLGMISIMRHNIDDRIVIEQCLEKMEKSSKMLMNFINDCLDISLMVNGEMDVNNTWFNVADVIDEIREHLMPLSKMRKQIFTTECDSLELFGDKNKLTRILINILNNSIKYTDTGGNISVLVTKECVHRCQVMMRFRIRDNGVGMSGEFVKQIFDPFSQEIKGASEQSEGSGLGMSIVRSLTELIHGSIDVYSTEGKGTEVVLEIPFEIHEQVKECTVRKNEGEEKKDSEFEEMYLGRRVLIAEDNALMSEIVATILGYRGLETDRVANGSEAVELYMNKEPFYYDLILMDVQMPVMNGLDATKTIRRSGKADAKLIPIVALSANAFNDDITKSLESGMNEHLTKPVGEPELMAAIGRLVI